MSIWCKLTVYIDNVYFSLTFNHIVIFAQLDPTAGKEYMGFIVAANPFAQMLFSPLVGWWSNRLGSIRLPLIVSLATFAVASSIYSSLELFNNYRKHLMLGSRFLVGVSSGKFFSFFLLYDIKNTLVYFSLLIQSKIIF